MIGTESDRTRNERKRLWCILMEIGWSSLAWPKQCDNHNNMFNLFRSEEAVYHYNNDSYPKAKLYLSVAFPFHVCMQSWGLWEWTQWFGIFRWKKKKENQPETAKQTTDQLIKFVLICFPSTHSLYRFIRTFQWMYWITIFRCKFVFVVLFHFCDAPANYISSQKKLCETVEKKKHDHFIKRR